MSNPWAISLMLLALVAAVVARGLPRAWLWLGAGALSFITSSLYWDYGDRVNHPIVTLMCDVMVCSLLYAMAKERWEMGVFIAFLTSVLCSLLALGQFIPKVWVYASLLEFCNLSAILFIGGAGIIDALGKRKPGAFRHWSHVLHSPRHPV